MPRPDRHQAALADYAALLRLKADDARTWFNQGFMLEAAGPLGRGLAAFRPRHRTRARSSTAPGTAWAWC